MRTEEDIETHRKRKELEEDIALGPRIGQMSTGTLRDDEDESLYVQEDDDEAEQGITEDGSKETKRKKRDRSRRF
jgi:hypothetical protein